MRHKRLNKRFGRNMAQRKQLMRSLVRALFISYNIETTVEKAKQARRLAEKIITLAKRGSLSNIRAINDVLQDRTLTKKVLKVISPLFKDRHSGYVRVIRTNFRKGDGAPLAMLELIQKPIIEKRPKKPKKERLVQPDVEKKPSIEVKKEMKKPALEEPIQEVRPKKTMLPKEELMPKETRKLPPEEKKELAKEKGGILAMFKRLFKKDR